MYEDKISDMALIIDGDTYQGYLYKLPADEVKNRRITWTAKLTNAADFYNTKTVKGFRFDEVILLVDLTPEILKSPEFVG